MSWQQIGQDIQGITDNDKYGLRTAISGDGTVVAFSAPYGDGGGSDSGEVTVYSLTNNVWVALGSIISGDAGGESSAVKLNNDGTRLIVGERWTPDNQDVSKGTAKIYEYSSGSWSQIGQDIVGEGEGDNGAQLGVDVSINNAGDRVILGARYWDKSNSNHKASNYGYIEVYDLVADGGNGGTGTWTLVGSRIEGVFRSQYGSSVDINSSGNRIIVGAPFGDINPLDGQANRTNARNTTNEGTFYVYEYSGGSWSQLGSQIWGGAGDRLGISVAINNSGDKIVVSTAKNNYWKSYEYNNGTSSWDQLGTTITTTSSTDITIDMNGTGDVVVVGDKDANSDRGEVKIYKYESGSWGIVGSAIAGQNAGDEFGKHVDISDQGDYISIGAPLNDDAGTNRGEGYIYYNSSLSDNSSDVSTSNVETAAASTTLKNEVVSDLNSIAGVSISASDISASATVVSTQPNVDYEFTVTITNVNLSDLSGAEQTSLINVIKSRYATDLSIDSSRFTITLREGSIEADVEIGSSGGGGGGGGGGSGNGKVTVKLNGIITVKGTGKITVK